MHSAAGVECVCDTGKMTARSLVLWQERKSRHCSSLQYGSNLLCAGSVQLQQLACGASLLTEPLRGAVIRALEMERRCSKWCAVMPAVPSPCCL